MCYVRILIWYANNVLIHKHTDKLCKKHGFIIIIISIIPICYAGSMEVHQALRQLSSVEHHPLHLQATPGDAVDVEPQVPPVHQGQHHAQRVLGLVGVRQVHLLQNKRKKKVSKFGWPLIFVMSVCHVM